MSPARQTACKYGFFADIPESPQISLAHTLSVCYIIGMSQREPDHRFGDLEPLTVCIGGLL